MNDSEDLLKTRDDWCLADVTIVIGNSQMYQISTDDLPHNHIVFDQFGTDNYPMFGLRGHCTSYNTSIFKFVTHFK